MKNPICVVEAINYDCCKKIGKNGVVSKKKFDTHFSFELIEITSFEELYNLLNDLRHQPKKSFIQGIPKNENLKTIKRNKLMWVDSHSLWLILDFDHRPSVDYENFIDKLPKPFREKECILKLSSSHLLNKRGSWQLIFKLNRPLSLPEKKHIANSLSADSKIYQPERLIFTADPIGEGAPKLDERLFWYDGAETVNVDDVFSTLGDPDSLEAALSQCLFKIKEAKEGDRNNTLNKQAFIAAQLMSGANIDPLTAYQQFFNAAKSNGMALDEIKATLNSAFSSGVNKPIRAKTRAEKDVLLDLAQQEIEEKKIELFHTNGGLSYIRMMDTAACYHLTTKSTKARSWLIGLFMGKYNYKKVPSSSAIGDTLSGLQHMAFKTGIPRDIYSRISPAKVEGHNGLYINLGNQKFIEVSSSGPAIIDTVPSPITFIDTPERGVLQPPHDIDKNQTLVGQLNILFPELKRRQRVLLAAWLLGVFQPYDAMYPILVIYGSHGTGKSTLAGILKKIVDPRIGLIEAQLNNKPKTSLDLAVACLGEHISVFDNLSYIDADMNDIICQIVQGVTVKSRALYTDFDQAIFKVHNPIILTAIERVATRSDMLSRSLIIPLARLEERIDNRSIESKVKKIQPVLLSCLVQAVTDSFVYYDKIKYYPMHRCASWSRWVAAATRGSCLGFSLDEFERALKNSERENRNDAIEASPIAIEIANMMSDRKKPYEGSLKDLYNALTDRLLKEPRNWPKSAKSLSNSLSRVEDDLREIYGIVIEKKHSREGNLWKISIDKHFKGGN